MECYFSLTSFGRDNQILDIIYFDSPTTRFAYSDHHVSLFALIHLHTKSSSAVKCQQRFRSLEKWRAEAAHLLRPLRCRRLCAVVDWSLVFFIWPILLCEAPFLAFIRPSRTYWSSSAPDTIEPISTKYFSVPRSAPSQTFNPSMIWWWKKVLLSLSFASIRLLSLNYSLKWYFS